MSVMLNINGSDDPSYRYKMPKLVGKIEGRGNGIKTVVVNALDISKSLGRPASQLTKFLGTELAAMSRYEEKIDRAQINGAFETADMQKLVFKYIERFVACKACGNPETLQELKGKKKSATIWLNCIACGETTEADNAHKLCTFILKEMQGVTGTTKKKKGRKGQDKAGDDKAGGEEGAEGAVAGAGAGAGAEEGDESASLASSMTAEEKKAKKEAKKAKKKEKKEKKKEKKEKKKKSGDKDKSKAKAKADASGEASSDSDAVGEAAATMETLTIHDVAAIEDSASKVRAFVEATPDATAAQVLEQVATYQVNCGLRKLDSIAIYYFAAVADLPPAAMTKHMAGLAQLVQSPEQQLEVLTCLEECVPRCEDEEKKAVALKMVPLVLKALYDEDVLEEDIIKQWGSGAKKLTHLRIAVDDETQAAIKLSAKPIVAWLETVEAEDDDDEDSAADGDAPAEGAAADTFDPLSVFGGNGISTTQDDETDSESDSDDE